jgi:hypothetical protein
MIFNMTRRFVVAVVMIVALGPQSLWSQRGAGRGGHGGAATTPKGEPSEDDSLKDFSRAVALQADAQQVDLFQQLIKDTTAAADKTADLAQHPERISQQADILAYVVEVARGESHDFIEALSRAQKSGLKTWWKNVEKADTEVGKSWKALSKDLTRDAGDEKRLAADNLNLQQALARFLAEQGKLAQRMSMPPRPTEGGDHPAGETPMDLHARPFQ